MNTTGNAGPWRLYSIDSFYRNDRHQWKSNHDRAYLARDIALLRSSLQVGEIYTRTSGTMTGAIPLRGSRWQPVNACRSITSTAMHRLSGEWRALTPD
ncbi:hypothetical protein DMB90_13165 [Raoultella planticola]|uniref:Uncharacterized protein n=1 Tax=Raoultella planticola TaxID=575 RepID=A0A5P6AA52_RAOPL|nr:hypothetical protein DMB90_13165 [Raoultella planticola]